MWNKKNSLVNRVTSGAMACMMAALTVMNPLATLPVYATQNLIDLDYKSVAKEDVEIYVQSFGESFEPGSDVEMKITIQNNTDKTLTKGGLSWRDNKDVLEDKAFVLLDDQDTEEEISEIAINEKGVVTNITLEPGAVYEVGFTATVDSSLELYNKRTIGFFFGSENAEDADEKITRAAEFDFTTGLVTLLPVEFEDDVNEVAAGTTGSMTLRLALDSSEYVYDVTADTLASDSNAEEEATDSDADEEAEVASGSDAEEAEVASDSDAEEEIATDSNSDEEAETATDSNTDEDVDVATDSDSDEEEDEDEDDEYQLDLDKINFDVVTYGVEFKDVAIVNAVMNESMNEVAATIEYSVDTETEIGSYFGKVGAEVKLDGKSYYATQGFEVVVTAELTEEQLAEVQNVIDLIAKLPSWEEFGNKTNEYDSVEDYEGLEAYMRQVKRLVVKTYDAYEALNDAQKALISEEDYLWMYDLYGMLSAMALPDADFIEETLDADLAYIDTIKISDIATGTAPFDDSEGAGNDTTAEDKILRTFDIATYTVTFTTALRGEAEEEGIKGYEKGRLYFEFILPYDSESAVFAKDGMPWLEQAQVGEVEVIDGVGQVLRGSYMLVPSADNPAAIGNSENELTVAIRSMRMHNGDTIQPKITLWLEYNDVGTEYENYIPTSIVTGTTNNVCDTHNEAEYKTIVPEEITISAAPRYNIAIVDARSSQNNNLGTYDFNIGSSDAINYGKGTVYGRLNGYGIRIEIDGKSGQGFKGVEFPDENTPITFNLSLESTYNSTKDTEYQPLYYSGGGNSESALGEEGRTVDAYKKEALTVPYNIYPSGGKPYGSVNDGGDWKFETVDNNTVKVTVSNFKIDTSRFPTTFADGTPTTMTYYDSKTINVWWDIDKAVFSAGEVWVLQPYYNSKNVYVVDKYSIEGTFNTVLTISNLSMKTESGDVVTSQTNTSDDKLTSSNHVKNPGNIDAYMSYVNNPWNAWNDTLVADSLYKDNDWAIAGQPVAVRSHIMYTNSDPEYRAVGFENLIKFDDEFFEPDASKTTITNKAYLQSGSTYRILWAAKPDGSGWSNDKEMKKSTQDDLIYYESLDNLKNAGKTPVAVLAEWRGIQVPGAHNVMMYLAGSVKADCEPNQVYMVVRSSQAWRMTDVDDEVAAYVGKSKSNLTDADYITYMTEKFPSHISQEQIAADSTLKSVDMMDESGLFTKDYPKPFWRQDWYYSNGTGKVGNFIEDTGMSRTITKASYIDGVYHAGTGAGYYQDSCLVTSFKTTITKSVAQNESGSTSAKKVYDMNRTQRVVDYVLYPKIERILGEGTNEGAVLSTVIYVEDTLPADLTYIDGSAYFGGEYTQDPLHQTQGTVTGGTNESTTVQAGAHYFLQEELTKNSDGTTTIRWSFPITMKNNQAEWSEPIYFSCYIGTPGDEETDVKNSDSIINVVKVWSEEDKDTQIEFTNDNGNRAEYGILILKTNAFSITKQADQKVVDWSDDIGYTMNIGNNSSNPRENIVVVETLPYNNVNGSSFTGAMKLKTFTVNDTAANFKFYYTTNTKYSNCRSESLPASEITTANGWTQLTLSGSTFTESGSSFPSESQTNQIVAIAAVGTLPANETLKMHVTCQLPDGKADDVLVNTLSVGSLEQSATSTLVSRNLEGLVWYDGNLNGEQDEAIGDLISGVKVSLWKLSGDTYIPYCYPNTNTQVVVETDKQISVQSSGADKATSYETGRYKFTDLEAGTYAVRFDYGDTKLDSYIVSPVGAIADDTKDSDGVKAMNGTDLYTEVTGIVMKASKEIQTGTGEVKNVDSGFGKVGSITIKKVVAGNLGDRSKEFDFTVSVNDGSYTKYTVTSDDTSITDGAFKLSHDEFVEIGNLPIDATIVITEVNDDYTAAIKVGETEKNDKDDSDTSAKVILNGFTDGTTIVFTNTKDAIVDTGILLDSAPYVLTLAIVFGGIAIYVINKRKKEDDLD